MKGEMKMKVNVKGKVMEKFAREAKTKEGTKYERMFVRLYQPGQRLNVDVNVSSDTYSIVDPGQEIELENVVLTTYNNMIFARQK